MGDKYPRRNDYDEEPPGGGGHGRVPWGIWAFFIAMMVWGAVYLVLFWEPQPRARGRAPEASPEAEQPAVDTAAQLERLREQVPADERARPNPLPLSPAVLSRGRAIYVESCLVCHGAEGDAQAPAAATMDPPPVDFTHPAFADLEPGVNFYIIARGSPGTGMPPWEGSLTEEDMWAVTHFLREAFTEDNGGVADP